jgi:predicted house-cleaning NTP pyrophosphatase (Maf/HAM1 superfamily)
MPSNRQTLTPALAGDITRLILEFESINRQRSLVDALIRLGVSSENYAEWKMLQRHTPFAVPAPLANDVCNLLRQVEKGIFITSNQLVRHNKKYIEKAVQAAQAAQSAAEGERRDCTDAICSAPAPN